MIYFALYVRSGVPLLISTLFFFIFCLSSTKKSELTCLIVRAQALDGKFIGTSVGGALIIIRNADTGEKLAGGLTEGSTGNTNLIMRTPKTRYGSITEGAAKFEAEINISEPTFLIVEVHTPYIKKQARIVAQTQFWLIPGKHIEGDGIIVRVPGFIVDALSPQTHRYMGRDELPVLSCGLFRVAFCEEFFTQQQFNYSVLLTIEVVSP